MLPYLYRFDFFIPLIFFCFFFSFISFCSVFIHSGYFYLSLLCLSVSIHPNLCTCLNRNAFLSIFLHLLSYLRRFDSFIPLIFSCIFFSCISFCLVFMYPFLLITFWYLCSTVYFIFLAFLSSIFVYICLFTCFPIFLWIYQRVLECSF